MPGTGNFEVLESGSVKANGRIVAVDTTESRQVNRAPDSAEQKGIQVDLKTPDIYKEFRLRGYDYGPSFQGIIGANIESKNTVAFFFFFKYIKTSFTMSHIETDA